jgi:hypothetical protein
MAPTFVPDYLFRLGGSNLVVGGLLFCGGLARFAAPLVGASRVGHQPLVKQTAIRIGTGMRIQVLGMALAALLLPVRFNLIAFALFYCAFNVLNGLQGVVFGLLMAKVIPLGRRGRFIGARDFAGGATAALVAWIAAAWLGDVAFPASHGFTYLLAFVFTSLGLICFAAIREPRAPVVPEQRSLGATLASMRTLLGTDPRFAWYCAARGLGGFGLMAAPFLIVAVGPGNDGGARELAHATVAFFAAGTIANFAVGSARRPGGLPGRVSRGHRDLDRRARVGPHHVPHTRNRGAGVPPRRGGAKRHPDGFGESRLRVRPPRRARGPHRDGERDR